jgi:hypothetical protein
MKNYRFYKDDYGWFIDIPEWEGEKWDLQMVMGADVFCDILSQGENEIYITLSVEPFDGCHQLNFTNLGRIEGPEYGEGAWYSLKNYHNIEHINMWLCDVTKFVFGDFPNRIYFR